LRIEYPGAFYHIVQRGNEKREIFTSDSERERFLSYLEALTIRYHVKIHTYCLMNNHYHLLIETPEANLIKAMHTLNTSYSTYFNKRKERSGHLFQGRYKSILVQADEYLHHLSRYIHLNPVRANLVKYPEDYIWSSYRFFISKGKIPAWLTTDFILCCFDKDAQKAKALYKDFVLVEIEKRPAVISDNIKAGFILGNDDFVEWVKETFIEHRHEDEEIPVLRQLKTRIAPEEIKEKVEEEIKDKKLARKLGIYLSRKYTGKKLKEIAHIYGKIGDTGISQVCCRVEKAIKENSRLEKIIRGLEQKIICNVET
jgi:putative transposase